MLATCYYRSGRINEAHAVLKDRGCKTPQNRFLMAKCCQDLNRMPECESVLCGDPSNGNNKRKTTDQVTEDFGDSAPFALRVLSAVYGATERHAGAAECERKALSLNPLLWGAFQALCDKGQTPDPDKCFSTGHLDSLDHVHGVNNILCLFNKIALSSSASPPNNAPPASAATTAVTVTSTPNLPVAGHAHHPTTATPILPQMVTPAAPAQMVTPANVDQTATPMDTTVDTTPRSSMTQSRGMMSGIGALNFSMDSNASTVESSKPAPAPSSTANFLAPPMMVRKRGRGLGAADGGSHEHHQQQHSSLTPASSIVQRLSSDSSLCTPTFGILPRQTTLAPKPPQGEGGGGGGGGPSVALKLDFSSPSLSVLSPCLTGPLDVPVQPVDKAPVKQKRVSSHKADTSVSIKRLVLFLNSRLWRARKTP